MEVQLIKQTNYFVNTQQWIETDEKQIFILDSKIKTKQNKYSLAKTQTKNATYFRLERKIKTKLG